jgi:hypothetical protein
VYKRQYIYIKFLKKEIEEDIRKCKDLLHAFGSVGLP